MSCNRENVIWQSKDGTWNRGFYEFWNTNENSDDFDPEWDVEYGEEFSWASTGHPSEEAAEHAWRGSNPGGYSVVHYDEGRPEVTAALDAKALAFRQTAKSRR